MIRKQSKQTITNCSHRQIKLKQPHKHLFKQIQDTLSIAHSTLEHNQFQNFYQKIIKSIIIKSEIQKKSSLFFNFLKKITFIFKPTLEIQVRLLLLQALCQLKTNSQQSIKLLTKIKHIVIDTQYEFFLSKVFIIQARIYQMDENIDLLIKSLRKCVSFSQSYAISSFLKHKQTIRKQITQNVIIAYFQLYKHKKQQNWNEAEDYLLKAYKIADRNFGNDNQITLIINELFINQKNIRMNVQKKIKATSSTQTKKAITEIIDDELENNTRIYGYYSWQDEKLIVQMIRIKKYDKEILQQNDFPVKLDYTKIKQLKAIEWVQIVNGQIVFVEDQIFKVLEGNNKKDNTITTKVGLKTITRNEIIKRDTVSSSSEDASFIEKEDFNFIRRLGRAQSAKKKEENK